MENNKKYKKEKLSSKKISTVDNSKYKPNGSISKSSSNTNSKNFSSRTLAKERLNQRQRKNASQNVTKQKNIKKIKVKSNVSKPATTKIKDKPINIDITSLNQKPKFSISRRNLILGLTGIGVVAAGASGIKFASNLINNNNNSLTTLKVPKNSVVNSDDFSEAENNIFNIEKEFKLTYGTLAWANSSRYITCLTPSNSTKTLSTVDLIDINSNKKNTIISQAQNQKEGYEIYNVRTSNNGIIWIEINILQNEWHVYCASLNNFKISNITLVDIGNTEWETPSIAINDNYAFWQVLPKANSNKSKFYSLVKSVSLSNIKANSDTFTSNVFYKEQIENFDNVIYKSNGRMSTNLYSYNNNLVITPRVDTKGVIHKLAYIDSQGKELDSICLPENMKPLTAGYGNTGFNFSFDDIYNFGEGISNLGTYTPMDNSKKYNNTNWLNFSRDPYSDAVTYNNYFIIRATMSVVCLDLASKKYIILNRPNASDDYGDYLASSGDCQSIVTYANIFDQPISGEEQKYCCLRIWK